MTKNIGKIVKIIGPVVDIEFGGKLPEIYNALTVTHSTSSGQARTVVLETEQHVGGNMVRAL